MSWLKKPFLNDLDDPLRNILKSFITIRPFRHWSPIFREDLKLAKWCLLPIDWTKNDRYDNSIPALMSF